VLVSTSSRVGERAAAGWRRVAENVASHGLKDQTRAVETGFGEQFARAHPDILRALTDAANAADPATYSEQAAIAANYDFTEALERLDRPVLVIQGEADRLTSPGGSVLLSRACRRSRLMIVPDAGHNVHLEMGEAFVALIEAFFDEVEAVGRVP
jgi:pimeloyl-ACP methyl ester carboxylesterase